MSDEEIFKTIQQNLMGSLTTAILLTEKNEALKSLTIEYLKIKQLILDLKVEEKND